ncbi:simple sugar transport system ATP-binding protein [Candidatus Nanopelagicus abundans]|jgi:simple sugar transport system ATP-binding protein|uniref:Simple sugar transport system ATP-binding protein n=1 Tax=Candidatus Nanopelagicus abundans TaxID=1884916 RepID=A0A249L399_9ACTN|nr:ABC transporter ATP-binding protein [Candidatus Nanopelagicus abundans]ASY23487.1 simple sugar transport system ATP-binding protein [Candidatus Nanopelagicus abundans]
MSIELKAITKKFGSLVANDSIDLKVARGEIHAILGENGAGKSTLMNIVYGLAKADSGKIFVEDKEVIINEPADALRYGIGMVHQHFMLIPVFTVAENIALGREESRGVFLTLDEVKKKIKALADEFKFDIDPDALIEDLPVGVQQRVEIIKALIYDAKVLILDEPTAVLTPQETDELLNIMRTLKKKGTSIIFITHKLREVKDVADKITIIRLGKVVGTTSPDTSQEDLASMMVGRQVDLAPNKSEIKPGRVILDVNKLNVANSLGRKIINSLSLQVKAGEILAIAGVQGNGQSELTRAILNLEDHVQGSIKLDEQEILGLTVQDSLRKGIAYIPESRELDGLIGTFSIAENLILDVHDLAPVAKKGQLNNEYINQNSTKLVKEFDIRTQSIFENVSALSGGNKQKVVLARELSRDVKLVVASQPTRGLDVGSIEFVYEKLLSERSANRAILLISSELDEVLELADRIAVIYKGEIVGEVGPDVSREKLGLMMAGIK